MALSQCLCILMPLQLGSNRHRSGVALAMRHRLGGLSTYGLNGSDEHSVYTSEFG